MGAVIDNVMLATDDDEARFRKLIKKAIKRGAAERYPAFEGEENGGAAAGGGAADAGASSAAETQAAAASAKAAAKKKRKRKEKAEREAKEAEELLVQIRQQRMGRAGAYDRRRRGERPHGNDPCEAGRAVSGVREHAGGPRGQIRRARQEDRRCAPRRGAGGCTGGRVQLVLQIPHPRRHSPTHAPTTHTPGTEKEEGHGGVRQKEQQQAGIALGILIPGQCKKQGGSFLHSAGYVHSTQKRPAMGPPPTPVTRPEVQPSRTA